MSEKGIGKLDPEILLAAREQVKQMKADMAALASVSDRLGKAESDVVSTVSTMQAVSKSVGVLSESTGSLTGRLDVVAGKLEQVPGEIVQGSALVIGSLTDRLDAVTGKLEKLDVATIHSELSDIKKDLETHFNTLPQFFSDVDSELSDIKKELETHVNTLPQFFADVVKEIETHGSSQSKAIAGVAAILEVNDQTMRDEFRTMGMELGKKIYFAAIALALAMAALFFFFRAAEGNQPTVADTQPPASSIPATASKSAEFDQGSTQSEEPLLTRLDRARKQYATRPSEISPAPDSILEPEQPVAPASPRLEGAIVEMENAHEMAWTSAASRSSPGEYYWVVQLRNDTNQRLYIRVTFEFLDENGDVVKTDRSGRTLISPGLSANFRVEGQMNRDDARSVDGYTYTWAWEIVNR